MQLARGEAKCNTLPQKFTLAPSLQSDINAQKQRAILLLLEGATITKTAETIGVDRSTMHRWLREPQFIAERNRRAKEAREACQERLRHLADAAVEVVGKAVESGNLKAALSLLKIVGLGDVGPGDEETAERRILCRLVEQYSLENWLFNPFDRQRYGSKAPLHNDRFLELKDLLYADLLTTYSPLPSDAEEVYRDAVVREDERAQRVHEIRERAAAVQKRRQAQP